MNENKGFTLAELMIVIVIIGIVMVASVPAIASFVQNWRFNRDVDQMAGMLRAARSAAVMKNLEVVFEFDDVNHTYSYFEDSDGDGVKGKEEYRSSQYEFAPGVRFDSHTLSGTDITFGPKGNTLESGSITIMNAHEKSRSIAIFGGTGNIRVD